MMEITNKYQVMPPLSEEEYQALKEDVAENGVLVPVVKDEDGTVIDGHYRVQAYHELEAEGRIAGGYPVVERNGLTEDEKRDLAWRLNMQRRHLNAEQKREAIRRKLKESPQWADNRVARLLGVDGKTVRMLRVMLEGREEIAKVEKVVGADGKEYPRELVNKSYPELTRERVEDPLRWPHVEVDEETGEALPQEITRKAYPQESSIRPGSLVRAEQAMKKAQKEQKKAADNAKKLREEIRTLKQQQSHEQKQLSETLKNNLQKQLADYQARHNIPEIPEIFQTDPEDFQRFLQNATDERQREALSLVNDAMKLVGRMMKFEPEEAATGFLRWNDRERAKEAMKRCTKWLNKCLEEIEAQTTPGRLRVIEKRD
jgi:ParB-like chromosome segregation protein Spo0J